VAQRAEARERLDASHARSDAGLGQDLEQADVSGRTSVCAAAEFRREVAKLDYAHDVAVFLVEDCHGPGLDRLGVRHFAHAGGRVLLDPTVREIFDRLDLAVVEC